MMVDCAVLVVGCAVLFHYAVLMVLMNFQNCDRPRQIICMTALACRIRMRRATGANVVGY